MEDSAVLFALSFIRRIVCPLVKIKNRGCRRGAVFNLDIIAGRCTHGDTLRLYMSDFFPVMFLAYPFRRIVVHPCIKFRFDHFFIFHTRYQQGDIYRLLYDRQGIADAGFLGIKKLGSTKDLHLFPIPLLFSQPIVILCACPARHPAHAAGVKLHFFTASRQLKAEMDITLFIIGIRGIALTGHRQRIGDAVIGADDPVMVTAVIARRIVLIKRAGAVLHGFDRKRFDIFIVIIE